MKYREIVKIISADGWVKVRQDGDDAIFKKAGVRKNFTLRNVKGQDLTIGAIKNVERITGLPLRR